MTHGPGLSLLGDVRVADFSHALSGPYCTLLLADLGADVVKIEPPSGDQSRGWGPPFVGPDSLYFASVNRSKRSVVLDLKTEAGRAQALEIVSRSDVMLENWAPGTAERLGLGADEVRARNPGLVYCSISGFGKDADAGMGYDQVVQGTSGVMSLTGAEGHPTKVGIPVADLSSGMFAALAVLGALLEVRRTGTGRTIDVSMHDSMVALLTYQAAIALNTGEAPRASGNGHPSITPYGVYETADGRFNLCVGTDAQFRRLCHALLGSEVAQDPRFATNATRCAHRDALEGLIDQTVGVLTTAAVLDLLAEARVPAGPVRPLHQTLADPLLRRRDMVLGYRDEASTEALVINSPWKFDGRAPTLRRPPPRLGADTRAVLDV
ncbi:MAG TPA: CoA transferase [Nocardioides sp.]|uniref:CaiB/BaiF CoA transferase family protein n=1 Tax=Nocardioides sp. TaxID=35761 RepID=UPI002E2FAFC9|nr:CoA transferase [Nocardioides sp.]HEX3931805.1 CoA transferase [Nocardioides sp.]